MSENKPTAPSLADLCRAHINRQLDKNFDYSLATNRTQDIKNFIQENKSRLTKNQLTVNTVRSTYTPLLDAEFIKRDKNPATMNRSTKGKKQGLKFNTDLNANITPNAQAGEKDTSPKPQMQKQDPNQMQMQMPQAYNEEGVSATFSALFMTVRLAIPDVELLSKEEKDALGKMWLPAFNLYLANEKYAVLGIPILATLGIFLPKILEGRKKAKIRKSASEGNERQKEIDTKNEDRQIEIKGIQKTDSTNPELKSTLAEIVEKNKDLPKGILPKKE